MDKFSYSGVRSLRKVQPSGEARVAAHIVPFGPFGGGQWTGHLIGLVIVMGFVAMGLVGVPEFRGFFALSLACGLILGCVLWLCHRSKSFF